MSKVQEKCKYFVLSFCFCFSFIQWVLFIKYLLQKLTKNSKLYFKFCHICIGRSLSIIDYCNFKICIGVWHPLIMTKLPFFGLFICCDPCSFFDFLFAFATLLLPCKDFCCCKDFAFGLRSLLMCLPSSCYLLSDMLHS